MPAVPRQISHWIAALIERVWLGEVGGEGTEYERQLRHDLLMGRYGIRKEVPTFDELPPELLAAAAGEFDPDRRILKLLGGRRNLRQPDGNNEEGHLNQVAFSVRTGGVDGT